MGRSLTPKGASKGFVVAYAPLMRQIGVDWRKRIPAGWSEKRKMPIIDLKGYGKKPSR